MRLSTITIAFLFISYVGAAQSLQVVDTEQSHNVRIGEEVRTTIKLRNLSDKPVNVLVRRDSKQLGSSQLTFFCWGGDCKDEDVDLTYISQSIQPGEILETFTSVLETGLDETASNVAYVFYNRDDPSDFVEVRLDYSVKEQVSQRLLYDSEDITISDIYPNPVQDIAYLDYISMNDEIETKLVLHNILGSVVTEYELNPNERELKIYTNDLKPGVYFYTIYLDSEGKVTKKLVVKR